MLKNYLAGPLLGERGEFLSRARQQAVSRLFHHPAEDGG